MSRYVYIRSERGSSSHPGGLWTVGFYQGAQWEAESDHSSAEAAAERVAWLNGSRPAAPDLLAALKGLVESIRRNDSDSNLSLATLCAFIEAESAIEKGGTP